MPPRRTILLVEADPGYAQALTLVLRQQGDEVEVAPARTRPWRLPAAVTMTSRSWTSSRGVAAPSSHGSWHGRSRISC